MSDSLVIRRVRPPPALWSGPMRIATLTALALLGVTAAGGVRVSAAAEDVACANRIVGTIDSEALGGSAAGDRISGLGGDDAVRGQEGDDCLYGGSGNDALWGGPGTDRVDGGPGDDRVVGDAGRDQLSGGSGADRIEEVQYGYPDGWSPDGGNNVIQGGPGA